MGAVPEETIEDNLKKWSADHLFDPNLIPGIIFSNKEIKAQKPSIYDIAPTILYLTGIDKKELEKYGFDGKTLFD